MCPVLYWCTESPPSRAVLMVAKTIGLELDVQIVNLRKKEQLDPAFLKINPQHTVPVLVEDDFVLWDSHAILGYFIHKYAENDSLYPKEPRKRAIVDQRLHFDGGRLFSNMTDIFYPMILEGVKTIPENKKKRVEESYGWLEFFLEKGPWVAGENLSIADFSIVCMITALDAFVPIDLHKYKKIAAWMKKCEELPYYHINTEGAEKFKGALNAMLGRQII